MSERDFLASVGVAIIQNEAADREEAAQAERDRKASEHERTRNSMQRERQRPGASQETSMNMYPSQRPITGALVSAPPAPAGYAVAPGSSGRVFIKQPAPAASASARPGQASTAPNPLAADIQRRIAAENMKRQLARAGLTPTSTSSTSKDENPAAADMRRRCGLA